MASAHTALKYGYNMIFCRIIPEQARERPLPTTLPLCGCIGGRLRGWIIRAAPSSGAWVYRPDNRLGMTNARGYYYLYAYGMDISVLDETPSGVSDNSGVNWVKIDIALGRKHSRQPVPKKRQFFERKDMPERRGICRYDGGYRQPVHRHDSGHYVKTFVEAVTAGWMDGSIAYYANATHVHRRDLQFHNLHGKHEAVVGACDLQDCRRRGHLLDGHSQALGGRNESCEKNRRGWLTERGLFKGSLLFLKGGQRIKRQRGLNKVVKSPSPI